MEAAVGDKWCHNKSEAGLQLESNQVTIAGAEGNNKRSTQHLGQAGSSIGGITPVGKKKKQFGDRSRWQQQIMKKTSLKFRCRWQQQGLLKAVKYLEDRGLGEGWKRLNRWLGRSGSLVGTMFIVLAWLWWELGVRQCPDGGWWGVGGRWAREVVIGRGLGSGAVKVWKRKKENRWLNILRI